MSNPAEVIDYDDPNQGRLPDDAVPAMSQADAAALAASALPAPPASPLPAAAPVTPPDLTPRDDNGNPLPVPEPPMYGPQMPRDLRAGPVGPTGVQMGPLGDVVVGVRPQPVAAPTISAPPPKAQPQPTYAGGGGGYYAPPAPQTPVELRAGVELADIKTPGEYSNELRALITSGEISPEEGRKRATEYRDWYGSVQGGATRLEGSGIAQQDRAQQVALEQQDADIQAAQKVAYLKAQAAQAAQDLAEQQKAAADAHAAAMRDAQGNLATAMQRAEEYKIDPSRTFSSGAGVAAGVLAGLGTMLGAIGQGLSRGQAPNVVPAMIERMIEREVDKQKAEQANLSRGVANRQNLMQLAKSHFDDDEQQRAVVKAAMYSTLAAQADQIASEATTDRAKRAAMLGAEQLRAKVADQQLAFETRTKAQAQLAAQQAAQQAAASQAASAAAKASPTTDALLRIQQQGGAVQIDVANDPVWGKLYQNYDATTGKYLLNEGAVKAAQGVANLKGVASSVDELRAIIARQGSSWDPQDRARAEALASNIKPRLAVAQGQGAMSEGDQANIEKGLPEGGFDLWGTQLSRLETMSNAIRAQAASAARALPGIPGAAPAMLPDENGVPRLYAQPSVQGLDVDRGFVEVGEGKSKKRVRLGATVGTSAPAPDYTPIPGATAPAKDDERADLGKRVSEADAKARAMADRIRRGLSAED